MSFLTQHNFISSFPSIFHHTQSLYAHVHTQGLTWWRKDDAMPPHRSGVYMIDLSSDNPQLVNLTFEGSYRESISPDFTPHGMGHWVTKDGEMILYVINHRRHGDVVDSFVYNPTKKPLKYRRSFESPNTKKIAFTLRWPLMSSRAVYCLYYGDKHYFLPLIEHCQE